jgi:uncharacterized protein (DUF488 family)
MRVAIMCAEKDPLDCHRCILVSPRLGERGIEVQHILSDGALETQNIDSRGCSNFPNASFSVRPAKSLQRRIACKDRKSRIKRTR